MLTFKTVLCVIAIYSGNGKIEYKEVKGEVLKTSGDFLVVDFQSSLWKLGTDMSSQDYVQRVPENACLYVK